MAIGLLQHVWKTYWMGQNRIDALRDVCMEIGRGDMVAVMGPSGSGKSTLLNILGCLDRPTEGAYLLGGQDVSRLNDNDLSEIRAGQIGFIFQSYQLIPQLSVVENIEVPLLYLGMSEKDSRRRAEALAEEVGLGERLRHLPMELSGGQCQRVAIARALAGRPLIVLADEPTGNLDSRTGAEILELIVTLNREGTTIILVTHDPGVARVAHRTYHMSDGTMVCEES